MLPLLARLTLIAACTAAHGAQAQQPQPVLEYRTADALRDRCFAHAEQAGHAVAVAVFDQAGELVSFANHGASPAAAAVAQWKGRSAALFRRSTRETGSWNAPTVPHIATIEGGVPLFTREGVAIGGVGVSGAPPEFDAECATVAATALGLAVAAP